MIITFCGHSNFVRKEQYKKLIFDILNSEIKNEKLEFYLGEYGSFDSFAYECAKEFKSIYKEATLVFVTPYLNQEYINKKAVLYDTVIYPEIESKPKKYAILERNKYMIKKSDIVIAYVEHSWGGAYKSLLLAKKANKKIYNLADK